MRLIDADALNKEVRELWRDMDDVDFGELVRDFWKVLNHFPTVDAEPVVRCRSCRHYNTECCVEGFGWCHQRDFRTNDEWYCADGEIGTYADE